MMSVKVPLEKKPFELFTKWSQEHLNLLNQRQEMFKEATESFLGVVRDSMAMKVPEESMKRLRANMHALCKLPLNTFGDNAKMEEYSGELKKLLAAMPIVLSENGFSEEFKQYGKASWANGSKANSACMNWMTSLLHGQKLTSDKKEAEEAVKNCLEATESFLKESVVCWLNQLDAGSGLVKHSFLKKGSPAQPVQ
jgi:hypothetical protein